MAENTSAILTPRHGRLENAQADYMVHLITTLGYIGDITAVNSIIEIINTQPKDPNIRQAAYEAMERLPSQKSAICLAQGLQDPVERDVKLFLIFDKIAELESIETQEGENLPAKVMEFLMKEADWKEEKTK